MAPVLTLWERLSALPSALSSVFASCCLLFFTDLKKSIRPFADGVDKG